jgi:hypothetical protein
MEERIPTTTGLNTVSSKETEIIHKCHRQATTHKLHYKILYITTSQVTLPDEELHRKTKNTAY